MALKIGDLANATGTKVQTIRYYEEIGLLPLPARTEGNFRTYDKETLRRLSFIRRSRGLGFSLDRVRELLGLADHRDWSCTAVETIAREHRKAIERKIADLSALDHELAQIIEKCGHGTVAECGILEALSPS
ncbi:helix-turn-helix domain-containing protein [Tardiphaga sp.]|jgi:DNA-binding transcriptional MerR regulator|uniref:MerR family transcriptional regulator n=1 Tax=Tardiphaga sp. TaxID=1926292 RepID=UPI00352A5151